VKLRVTLFAKRFSVSDRALRSVAVSCEAGWHMSEYTFVNAVPISERHGGELGGPKSDSTLSPKEGKWHQPRRRRL